MTQVIPGTVPFAGFPTTAVVTIRSVTQAGATITDTVARSATVNVTDTGNAFTATVGRKGSRVDATLSLAAMQTVLDALAADGVEHIRATAAWPTINPSSGTFVWTQPDRVFTQATNRGMTVSFTVDGMPGWVNANGYWTPPRTSGELSAWQTFAQTLSARYAGQGVKAVIYECWNEPDQGTFWQAIGGGSAPDPVEYAAVLRAFYAGIKAGDPNGLVAGVNCNRTALGYIGAVYDALETQVGVPACHANNYYFDILALHPYCLTHPPDYPTSDDTTDTWGVRCRRFLDFSRAYDLVNTREGKHKQLIMGEFGYSTTSGSNGPITDATRATYLPLAYSGIRAAGYVHSLTWYTFADATNADFDIQGTTTETAMRAVAPTATSSSSLAVRATRTVTDTGTTSSSTISLSGAIIRSVASTGATITSSVTASSSSHTFPRSAADTLTFTDVVKRLVHPFGPTDRGLALTDSALRGQKLQPGVTQSTPGVYEIGLSFVDAGIDTVEITPLVDDAQGRIRIFIQAPSNAATVTVTRTHPSNTSVTVRGMTNAPISSNIFLGYDYEAPIGRELRYQATAYDALGVPVGSSSIETISWDTNDTWIKDPLNPGRNIRILMADPGEEAFDAPTGLNTVLGRPTPIVVTEVRQAATGTLNILTLTDSDAGTLHLLTSTGNILLVQTSPAYGLGNLYFALQKIAAGRVTPLGFLPERSWGLQYVETDAPVGIATGGDTTWQLVLVGYATWNSLLNTESSWLDLLENINTLSGPAAAPTLAWRGA